MKQDFYKLRQEDEETPFVWQIQFTYHIGTYENVYLHDRERKHKATRSIVCGLVDGGGGFISMDR
jgi:hypothetical protein